MLNNIKQNKKYIIVGTAIIAVFATIAYFMLNNSYASGTPITDPTCIVTSLGESKSTEIEVIDAPLLTDEQGMELYPLTYTIENVCDQPVNYQLNVELNRITNIESNKIRISNNDTINILSDLTPISNLRGRNLYNLHSGVIVAKTTEEKTIRIWQTDSDLSKDTTENTISIQLLVE